MKKILLYVAGLALLASVVAISQTPAAPKHHTVFQLTEPDGPAWSILELHAANLKEAMAKEGGVEVEVIFFGAGLNMLKKTNKAHEDKLKHLVDMGVKLTACQNAMKLMNVKTEDLFPFAGQVDSAVAELTRKQEAGWAYIH
jgi:intracellular sulfur oxidation DsrE/DsrF family protein